VVGVNQHVDPLKTNSCNNNKTDPSKTNSCNNKKYKKWTFKKQTAVMTRKLTH